MIRIESAILFLVTTFIVKNYFCIGELQSFSTCEANVLKPFPANNDLDFLVAVTLFRPPSQGCLFLCLSRGSRACLQFVCFSRIGNTYYAVFLKPCLYDLVNRITKFHSKITLL